MGEQSVVDDNDEIIRRIEADIAKLQELLAGYRALAGLPGKKTPSKRILYALSHQPLVGEAMAVDDFVPFTVEDVA